jgi:flagellar motor protein MotB
MNRRNVLVNLLAVVLVGSIVFILYFSLGPYKRLSRDNQGLRKEIMVRNTSEAKMEEKIGELTGTLEETRGELAEKTQIGEELHAKVDGLEERISQIAEEKGTLATDVGQLRRALAESIQRQSGLTSEIESYRQRVEALEGELAERTGEVEGLETEAVELRNTITALEAEREALGDEVQELERDLQGSRDGLLGLSLEAASREKEFEEAKLVREALIGRLRGEIDEKAEEIGGLKTEIEDLKHGYEQRVEALEGELAERTGEVEGLETEAVELRNTITALEAEREALGDEVQELERDLQGSKDRLAGLSQEMASSGEKFQKSRETLQALIVQLEQQVQEKEVRMSILKERLTIQFLDKVLFKPGNARITPQGSEILKKVAQELKKLSGAEIRVEGHTDNQPLSENSRAVYIDNLGLSVARAAAVARTLRTMGVDPRHLSSAGYSMYRPVASNATPEGQQENRRVEIRITPLR